MKKRLWLLAAAFAFCMTFFTVTAKADEFVTYLGESAVTGVATVAVSDIDNTQYPATKGYYLSDGTRGVMKFVIETPSTVKAYYSWASGLSTSVTQGQAWISQDEKGIDMIGTVVSVKSSPSVLNAYLDPGTYYLNTKLSIKANGGKDSSAMQIGIAIMCEDARSDEYCFASSYTSPNTIVNGMDAHGFLSMTAPQDYYRFELASKSRITLKYNFVQKLGSSVTKGMVTLLDANNCQILVKGFSNSASSNTNYVETMLEAGTYYVKLSGVCGPTFLHLDVVDYDIKCTLSTEKITKKPVTLTVSTGFNATEILVCEFKEVFENDIRNSTLWNPKNDGIFDISSDGKIVLRYPGVYTVRVRDDKNNYYLKTIEITNLDPDKPVISNIKQGGVYSGVTVKVSDANLKVIKLDGKKVSNGKYVTKKGDHTLMAKDKAGNKTTVKFTIK